ncbi:LamG-like jellyroll fold domain-containing protein [Nocardioides sp. LHD-245]|uniref:LamG-like jellyroll fold domain-containing protein n=1 Tax=Nocardioides sp. LHD-245 TaxID=3051387 RepID=UPI0027DFF90A|nr:LamG-like jellyroll fold domain-containing protein [Nocardioides sp. LHD-245]
MPARPMRRLRLLATSVVAAAVASGGLMATPSQAAPAAAPALLPETPSATAEPAPTPDILDVGFPGGVPTDAAQSLAPITYGTPTYGTDVRQGPVMTVDGVDDAVGFAFEEQWPKLTTGASIECVFRVDTAMPVVREMDLCSDKEAGGLSMYVTGGNLGFMGHIGGGYKSALTPIEGDRWYHAVATWDGSQIKLYVNGQLAQTTAAAGALTAPAAAAQRFIVGADASPTGIGQPAPPSTFAASGVFSRAVTADEVKALAAEWDTAVPTPAADVLDVDFADGTPKDRVRDLAVKTFGSPTIAHDNALGRDVASFDGDDAYGYALTPHWGEISNAVTLECTFRYLGTLPRSTEAAVCSGKEAGGLSIYLNEDKVGLMAHIGGGYKTARATFSANRWYHVVGLWTGTEIRLYVDGVLAATTPATGALTLPNATARAWTLGADSSPNGGAQFYAPARLANARIYSRALNDTEIKALDIAAFGEHPDAGVSLTSSVPAAGDSLSAPVELDLDIAHEDNAAGWTYLLDGKPVAEGDLIGPGLQAGPHTLTASAVDVFGKEIAFTIPFESDTIPTGGGAGSGEGKGVVQLSAIATSPDGGEVTTTFREATATVADGGVQGVVKKVPTTLDFVHEDEQPIAGELTPDDGEAKASATSGDIPFQRFDVAVGAAVAGQQVVWKGVVDPERSVTLHAWSTETSRWAELATARGVRDGDTVLNAVVRPAMVDQGTVHLLVLGTDPFADDLAPRDESAAQTKDRFEDPEDYDFSLAHFTDTQYLAEGAAGGTYDDWDGNVEPSDQMKEAERAIWDRAYRATTEWIAEQAGPRKIKWAGHTGDIIENDYYNPLATNGSGGLLYPGLDEQVTREFEFTSDAQQTLDGSGIPNQVIAGNHDNQLGNETGPTSRFNRYYGPDRYYEVSKGWPAGASYHAWDETTDSEGNVSTPGQDNQNNYILFSAGGLDFVAVGLSYGVTQEEADWASSVFERYPDRNGILLTHAYIAPSTAKDGRGASFSGDGSKLYDEVVSANPNVFLILAGHEHGVGTNLKTGVGATVQHDVVELLADYQFYKVSARELWPDKVDSSGNIDLDGDGVTDHKATDLLQFGASWLRLLQFDVDRAEVSIDTYSPHFDNFGATEYDDRKRYNGAEDNLVLPVDLSSRTTTFSTDGLTVVTPTAEVIGVQTARSGWPATVEWKDLTAGVVYAWTAESRTTSGDRIGSLPQFGTVFRATAAGTDVTAPTIEVPAETTLTVGDRFVAKDGVTATDDVDGDLTTQMEVVGDVDTGQAGSYPLTYVVADKNGNQAIVSRVVRVVEPVDARATTAVTVGNVSVAFGQQPTLSAQVSPASATGLVRFLEGEEMLCEAMAANGTASCTVKTLPPPGDYVVVASYAGDKSHQESQRSFVLKVAAAQADPRLKAKAAKASLVGDAKVKLKAKVAPGVTGRVVFKSGGRRLCVATIEDGVATCRVRLRPGTWKVKAKYAGSAAYAKDKAVFTVRKR